MMSRNCSRPYSRRNSRATSSENRWKTRGFGAKDLKPGREMGSRRGREKDPGFGRLARQNPLGPRCLGPRGSFPPTRSARNRPIGRMKPCLAAGERNIMKTYIPKQTKLTKERLEAKLEAGLLQKLERYCQYLDSDRDYVLSQVLQMIFKKGL